MKKTLFCVFVLLHACICAQLPDTVKLRPVELLATRPPLQETGKKIYEVDSLQFVLFRGKSLADLISGLSATDIRNYGINGTASISFRGTSADHTAVLWEGVPLQNPAHGQFDFSLFPVFFMDQLKLEPGAGPGQYGSGAVGGGVSLESKPSPQKGFSSSALFSAGSFDHLRAGIRADYSSEKVFTSTRLWSHTGKNDFPVRTFFMPGKNDYFPLKEPYTTTNSAIQQHGIMQVAAWKPRTGQEIKNAAVLLATVRGVPNTSASQQDRNFRNITSWSYRQSRFGAVVRAGWQRDEIVYDEPNSNLHAVTDARSASLAVETWFHPGNNSDLYLNGQTQHITISADGYGNLPVRQLRTALWGGFIRKFFSSRLLAELSVRQQWATAQAIRPVPSAGLKWKSRAGTEFRLHYTGIYHLPDFNDLYWVPGGNPGLKPEQGNSAEAGISFPYRSFRADITLFRNNTRNLIIWKPGSAYWAPENLAEVKAGGAETRLMKSFVYQGFRSTATVSYNYVLAEAEKGRQQIFIPRHRAVLQLSLQYRKYLAFISFNYASRRYLSADNLDWLPGTGLVFLRLSKTFQTSQLSWDLFLAANNLTDHQYMSVPGYPLPGRNFETGITIQYR